MIFRNVTVEDGLWARPILELHKTHSCEYAFANTFMWSPIFKTSIARFEDYVLVRGEGPHTLHYLWPAGAGDRKAAIDLLLEDARAFGKKPALYSMNEDEAAELETLYPGYFAFDLPRGQMDYLYKAEDLATLAGKKYQKKRNHCSRFERQYPDWGFHAITADTMDAVITFNNARANLYDNRGDIGIADEHVAVDLALSQYEALGLRGGYITTGGEIVAFCFGSVLNGEVFVTHVEKALYEIPGAYNIINREMARSLAGEFTYINRENDLDREGLRGAKESYHPAELVPKYTAIPKNWEPPHV